MATAVIMPRQGQSVESCILVEWLVNAGDDVSEGTPIASIETDKAVFEVESPAAGTLLECFFEEGADIPVLINIAAVGEPGEDVSDLKPDGASDAAPSDEQTPEPATTASPAPKDVVKTAAVDGAVGVSPRARNLAAEKGVDARQLAGTGPRGRVIERDVKAAAEGQPRMTGVARDAAAAGMSVPAAGSGPAGMVLSRDMAAAGAAAPTMPTGEPTTETLTGIRKIIAEKMHASLANSAQLTMNMSFDATAILAYRAQIKAQAETLGLPNITINDIIAFATVRTLLRHPELNAHFADNTVTRFPNVNLGVAMDTPRGLMVPVVHGAERLSLAGLSQTLKPIIENAQSGSVNPDLLTGGTFTITNLGMMGIENFTPILNAPEVAILGVGGLTLKPVEANGDVKHVKAINLSLTIDHQVIDGGPGARFLKSLCGALENFALTLAG